MNKKHQEKGFSVIDLFHFQILSPGAATINPYIAVNILIVVGVTIMILGFLGCFGAMKENQFVLLLVSFPEKSPYPTFRL